VKPQGLKSSKSYWFFESYRPPGTARKLSIRICRAGDTIKSAGDTYSEKVVVVIIVWISILIILDSQISIGYTIEVVKESFSGTKLKGEIPFRIIYILESKSKGYGSLNTAVLVIIAGFS
jgi:hypothetical protein